jgi:transcription initiation factor TFIIIB Brf1 subunit/transcription initiation factor TFIIB
MVKAFCTRVTLFTAGVGVRQSVWSKNRLSSSDILFLFGLSEPLGSVIEVGSDSSFYRLARLHNQFRDYTANKHYRTFRALFESLRVPSVVLGESVYIMSRIRSRISGLRFMPEAVFFVACRRHGVSMRATAIASALGYPPSVTKYILRSVSRVLYFLDGQVQLPPHENGRIFYEASRSLGLSNEEYLRVLDLYERFRQHESPGNDSRTVFASAVYVLFKGRKRGISQASIGRSFGVESSAIRKVSCRVRHFALELGSANGH